MPCIKDSSVSGEMITDIDRYMITRESAIELGAPMGVEMIQKHFWITKIKMTGIGQNGLNRILYVKPKKNALFKILDSFMKRRSEVYFQALSVSVNFNGENGTDINVTGCEQKLKYYLDVLRTIDLFEEANKKRINTISTSSENDRKMNESRKNILTFIRNTCYNICLTNEYRQIGQKNEDGNEMTAMQVIAKKATVWREIGHYLEIDHLQLKELYEKYCLDLASTLMSDEINIIESVIEHLNRCTEKETMQWNIPECLQKKNTDKVVF